MGGKREEVKEEKIERRRNVRRRGGNEREEEAEEASRRRERRRRGVMGERGCRPYLRSLFSSDSLVYREIMYRILKDLSKASLSLSLFLSFKVKGR